MGTATRLMGLAFLLAAVAGTINYPECRPFLAAGLALYGIALWRRPPLWLFAIPALLPFLDLSPITGRLLLDEFDLLILVTLGVQNLRRTNTEKERWPNRLFPAAILILWLSWLVATTKGLWPLFYNTTDLAPNSHTPFDAWQVGKGLLWALLLIPLLRRIPWQQHRKALNWFQNGIVVGLLLLTLVVLWERHTFVGLGDFDNVFRVTGSFSSMNTGGAYIEAFIAFAFPLLVAWILKRRNIATMVLGIVAVITTGYAMLVTFSRGGYGGLVAGLLVVGYGVVRQKQQSQRRRLLAFSIIALVCVAMAVPVLSSGFARQRLEQVAQDLSIRLLHWKQAIRLMDDGPVSAVLGEGFGRYPSLYRDRANPRIAPGSFQIADEDGNHYVRLGAGEPVYLDQIVPIDREQELTLSARIRAPEGKGSLQAPLCEKALLYSFDCVWQGFDAATDKGTWETWTRKVDVTTLKQNNFWFQTPIKLSLYNPSKNHPIEVDNISLKTKAGEELLVNGNFEQGARHWLFVSDQDLAWHIHQQWVETYVAQGWLGILATALLLAATALTTFPVVRAGNLPAAALTGGLIAFLAVGLLGSTVDTPRLSLLFFLSAIICGTICADPRQGLPHRD